MHPDRSSTEALSLVVARWLWLWMLAAVASSTMGTAPARQNVLIKPANADAGGLRHALLRGITSSQTLDHINRNDAHAALQTWFDIIARQRGFSPESAVVDIVEGVAAIRERLKRHSVEMVTLSIAEYLELESGGMLSPVLTDVRSGQTGALYSYLLLIKSSSAVTTIGALRGKKLQVSSRGGSNTGVVWTDVLLGKEKLGRAASFFASVTVPDKAQACILALYFGTVDACVVDEVSFNLAKELNPQLGQLRILARSRPLMEAVIATPAEPHPYEKEMIDAMLSLHDDTRRRQVLMVFKTDRIMRIQPGDLDAARELWRDYGRLPAPGPTAWPAH